MADRVRWWQKGVIYQVYPRSFMDSNHDGIGDIGGVISKLDYLEWLGIKAIWFSPIFPSPMADFGYDISDYTDIHPDYGSLADFDRLLIEAHRRNLKVILDLVPNHTSDEHQWFIESRSSRDNPKRDWYIWRDPKPDGSRPNNWVSYFEGPAWTFNETTGQYYLHNFHPKQPDLNWRNPEVQQAMFDIIRFWLSRGVDGFRIDVIDRILKDPQFRDNPPNPHWKPGDSPLGALDRIYSERQYSEIYAFLKKFRVVFDEYPDSVAIGEMAYDVPIEKMIPYYGDEKPDAYEGDGIHLPFNFQLIMMNWDAAAIRQFVDDYDASTPPYAWPNYVLGNHDQPRLANRLGQAQARVAALLLLTLRGTPTIYYGEELGMENVHIPPARMQDPQGVGGNFNRDECRTPMRWDASTNAGFTTPEVQPWLPIGDALETINVAYETEQPGSMLSFYHRLLHYRQQTPALHRGRYYPIDPAPVGTYIYLRSYNDQRCIVAVNFTAEAKHLDLSAYKAATIILSTHSQRDGQPVQMNALTLHPNEGLLLELTEDV